MTMVNAGPPDTEPLDEKPPMALPAAPAFADPLAAEAPLPAGPPSPMSLIPEPALTDGAFRSDALPDPAHLPASSAASPDAVVAGALPNPTFVPPAFVPPAFVPPAFVPPAFVPPPPKPKPEIRPERDGEGYRTEGIRVEREAGSRSFYLTLSPPLGKAQKIYLSAAALEGLITIATEPTPTPGKLWRSVSAIPIERPLPSRQLEEELRLLLVAFAAELRRAR